MSNKVILAENIDAGGTLTAKVVQRGTYVLMVKAAVWGGGNTKVNAGTPWASTLPVPNSTLTADGIATIVVPDGTVTLSITTATGVYAYLFRADR